MNRKITFRDKENKIVRLEISIKDGRFSISGETRGSLGQVMDLIVPASRSQEELLKIWENWHLNDLHPGTEKQEEALEKYKRKIKKRLSYEEECEYLKSIGLYEDNGYKYGTGWIKRELPENFEEDLNDLLDEIEIRESCQEPLIDLYNDENELYNTIKEIIQKKDLSFDESDIPIIMMFAEEYKLSANDLESIYVDGNYWDVLGDQYLAGTDDEMEEEYEKALDDRINEFVLSKIPDKYHMYIDMEHLRNDLKSQTSRAELLNLYDCGEIEYEYNGIWYYAYRR